ncbi:MAG: hypothetical protein AAB786_02245 [Patescibacteria group bacterium]
MQEEVKKELFNDGASLVREDVGLESKENKREIALRNLRLMQQNASALGGNVAARIGEVIGKFLSEDMTPDAAVETAEIILGKTPLASND